MPSQLSPLDENVQDTKQAARTSLTAVEGAIDALELVRDVFEVLEEIDEDAGKLEDIAKGLKNAMKLVSKLGPPLSGVAPILQRVLDKVEDRARDVANGIDVESDFGVFKDRVDNLISGLEPARDALEITVAELAAVETGISDAADAVETAASIPAELQNALARANLIAGNLNSATSGITDLAEDINTLQARIDGVFGDFPASVSTLLGAARDFSDLIGKVDFLQTPMDVLNDALEPVQWALDAAEAVINAVINPVLDPILDSLGVSDLFDKMAGVINDLVPELALFTGIDADLGRFEVQLGDLTVDTPGLDIALESDLMARMRDDVGRLAVEVRKLISPFGPVNVVLDDAANLAIGYDGFESSDPTGIIAGGTRIDARGGDDLVSGGLGADVLNGGLGNDVLIGGAGDDVIDGGVGTDGVMLQGFLSEFSFTRDPVTDAIIVSHTHGAPGTVDLGTDVISGVEYFLFKDRTLSLSDFDYFYDAAQGETRGDGLSLPTVPVGASRDFMFGTDDAESISSFAQMDYITARGGNDTLDGGTGDDFLEGGEGFDRIVGGPGSDVGSYLGEAGSPHFASLLPAGDPRQPFISEDLYFGVEKLTGSDNADWLWGDDAANRLDGRGGNDVLRGLGGNDSLISGEGTDLMIGGAGNDVVIATGVDYDPTDPSTIGRKVMVGGTGRDSYVNERGNFSSLWYGGVDFETTFAAMPSLALVGLTASDLASTLPDHLFVNGAAGFIGKYDAAGGLAGIDSFQGGLRIFGATGNDTFLASDEQDFYLGGAGNDTFIGGARNLRPIWDTSDPQNSFTVNDFYDGGAGSDVFRPTAGRTNIEGGSGNDRVEITQQGWLLLNGSERTEPADSTESDELDFAGSHLAWAIDLGGTYIGDPLKLGYRGVAEGHEPGTMILPDETDYASFDSLQRQLGTGDGSYDVLLGQSYLEIRAFERVTGSAQSDFIAGNDRANVLSGGAGNDVILGHAGATDFLSGEAGDDTVIGSTSDDNIFGGDGNDDLRNAEGSGLAGGIDRLVGGDGNDVLRVFDGFDRITLNGGDGADLADFTGFAGPLALDLSLGGTASIVTASVENLRGTLQGDVLTGNARGNNINGQGGDDLIDGGIGNDVLFAGAGSDTLLGGGGNDLLVVGLGGGWMDGGVGIDTASFGPNQFGDLSDGTAGWQPRQTAGQASASLADGVAGFRDLATGAIHSYTLDAIENLSGSTGDDDLTGDRLNNRLTGDAGDDLLTGLVGNDTLSGGDGDDTLRDSDDTLAFRLNEDATRDQLLGLDGYADMPAGSFTVDLSFRATEAFGTTDTSFLSYAVPGSTNELLIYGNPGANGFEIWLNGQHFVTNVPIQGLFDSSWHRIALSVLADTGTVVRGEKAGFTLYVDGESVFSYIASVSSTFNGLAAGGSFIVGQEQDAVNGGFDPNQVLQGEVAEVGVWDRALGSATVRSAAVTPIADPVSEPGLVSLWRPDPASGLMVDALGGAPLTPRTTDGSGPVPQIVARTGGGNDVMNGGAGDDLIDGGFGRDDLNGGADADTLLGGHNGDTLTGGEGGDMLMGQGGDDLLYGENAPVAAEQTFAGQVYRLYEAALDRGPDFGGLQSWVSLLSEGGATIRDVAGSFVRSAEFTATYGPGLGDDAFVELLYQNVLDRGSDPTGKQSWLDAMENGASRAQVLLGFSQSDEFRAEMAADAEAVAFSNPDQAWSDDVFRVYQATLDRTPDLGGFLHWSGQLGGGASFLSVVECFVNSAEFRATYGPDPSDGALVDLMYQNVLDRGSDVNGRQAWLDFMADGGTRAQVVRGFAQSAEFVADTADAVEAWIRAQGTHDTLAGGAGSNVLAGGILSDAFVFDVAESGSHDILDLEAWDTLDFRSFGYADDAEALSHMAQTGADVVFADRGVSITIQDTDFGMIGTDMILV